MYLHICRDPIPAERQLFLIIGPDVPMWICTDRRSAFSSPLSPEQCRRQKSMVNRRCVPPYTAYSKFDVTGSLIRQPSLGSISHPNRSFTSRSPAVVHSESETPFPRLFAYPYSLPFPRSNFATLRANWHQSRCLLSGADSNKKKLDGPRPLLRVNSFVHSRLSRT